MIELSVIVPVYNSQNYLRKCVESILNQTFKNLELILVNDGSSDQSAELCEEYEERDDRVRVIHKKNGGASSARNAGIEAAKGAFIAFVDADDYIEPNLYELVMPKAYHNDIVFFHYTIEKEGKEKQIYQRKLMELKNNSHNFMLFYTDNKCGEESILSVFSWRSIYNADLIKHNGISFPISLRTGEDRIFLFKLLLVANSIGVADEVFGYHYVIRGSASLTGHKDLVKYIPWLFEQNCNMDEEEQSVCKINTMLSEKDLSSIRLQRAEKMRQQIIVNEFKNNKENAKANMRKYWKIEFFRYSFKWKVFFVQVRYMNWKDTVKFLLVKLRCYRGLALLYR